MRPILTCLLAAFLLAPFGAGVSGPVAAEGRSILGWGRLFDNDALGDHKDRWRTGSYAISIVTGSDWSGRLPDRPGEILEFRFRSEVVAPDNLTSPAPGDRRYAGILSAGVHTHFSFAGLETSAGLDLVAMGPMTGVGSFQTRMHKLLGLDKPDLSNQFGNSITPTFTGEVGRSFSFGSSAEFRPFAEISAGLENFARVGGDFSIGSASGGLMVRDVVTGQRYAATERSGAGFTFNLGGDVAKVYSSELLPADQGYQLTDSRVRLRAGLGWQGASSDMFYGVTWLGREFEGQPEGQVVGSLHLGLRF